MLSVAVAVRVMMPAVPASAAVALGAVVSGTVLDQAAPTLMPWKAFHTACSSGLPAP